MTGDTGSVRTARPGPLSGTGVQAVLIMVIGYPYPLP